MKYALILLALLTQLSWATERPLIFNVGSGSNPPYSMDAGGGRIKGISLDLFTAVASRLGYPVAQKKIPQRRRIELLLSGDYDSMMAVKAWIGESDEYRFSKPVMKHRDVIFSHRDDPILTFNPEHHLGQSIIARRGYTYPTLEGYFSRKKILRINTKNESAMLRMLYKRRANMAVISELVGKWLISREASYQGLFVISDNPVEYDDYRFVFSKRWGEDFMRRVNSTIEDIQTDGTLEAILRKYS